MDIKSQISNYGPKNEELLSTLSNTDYAPPALQQQKKYIKDLEETQAKTNKEYEFYLRKTKAEQKDFEKYRDSTMKRFAYRMGGSKGKEKFASKHEKEEKEYYEALHAERQCKDSLDNIASALKEARDVNTQYQRDADANAAAQKELDNLYHMIFAGPTPAFPEEDQKEWPYTQAKEAHGHAEQNFQAVSQALGCLNSAMKHMQNSQHYIQDALSASRMDMFGGGAMADMAERDALSKAESEANQLQGLVNQARRMYPEIEPIGQINIAKGSLMSDVLFDNIFTDMNFHEKIKSSAQQLGVAGKNLFTRIQQVQEKARELRGHLDQQSARLREARKDLQLVRQHIFESVKAEGANGGPPPAYAQ